MRRGWSQRTWVWGWVGGGRRGGRKNKGEKLEKKEERSIKKINFTISPGNQYYGSNKRIVLKVRLLKNNQKVGLF